MAKRIKANWKIKGPGRPKPNAKGAKGGSANGGHPAGK